MVTFAERLREMLDQVLILPQRMRLETPGVRANVPMLRGVWGAALHDLAPDVYHNVFDPAAAAPASEATPVPGYVLRPAPPDPNFAPAIDWLLFGSAIQHEPILRRAWDIASGMGLGKLRKRFCIRQTVVIRPDGEPVMVCRPWPLSVALWPWPGPPETTPCRLSFPAPLRILYRKRLVETPQLPDVVAATVRRVSAYLPAQYRNHWDGLARQAVQVAREVPCGPWFGARLDLHRYSGRQRRELQLFGVSGHFDLPDGPGPLWPLLLAAHWLHIGKGTVMGLGQLRLERIAAKC